MRQYAELHARSAFTFLEGGSLPEELIAVAAAADIPAKIRNGIKSTAHRY